MCAGTITSMKPTQNCLCTTLPPIFCFQIQSQ
uniref:Uncharacterized protein n=1 Tax=Rhizophora mucronata TaxID=61149 RepID=A0A2P2QKG4_RHIMU